MPNEKELESWTPDRRRAFEESHRAADDSGEWIVTLIMVVFWMAVGLFSLYGLVRFVKWAWEN